MHPEIFLFAGFLIARQIRLSLLVTSAACFVGTITLICRDHDSERGSELVGSRTLPRVLLPAFDDDSAQELRGVANAGNSA